MKVHSGDLETSYFQLKQMVKDAKDPPRETSPPACVTPTKPGLASLFVLQDDPAYDEVALSAALKLAVERSEYYNEDKKAADAVVRSLRPKGPRKGKKGQDEDEEP